MSMPPFHLAFPVHDLQSTRRFYVERLGCKVGRSSERWIDFDFFGHQITAHLDDSMDPAVSTNAVDGKAVPVRHFGAVLDWEAWQSMAAALQAAGTDFLIEPHVRFPGEVGEQATMFLTDPSGNGLEFKAFKDPQRLFATGSGSLGYP